MVSRSQKKGTSDIGPFSGKKVHYNRTKGQAIFSQKKSGTDFEKIISTNNTNYRLDYFGSKSKETGPTHHSSLAEGTLIDSKIKDILARSDFDDENS